MAAPARLRFDGIRRRFGKLAVLTGVSGAVESGGVLLVTGPNGSGKSTLLRCLAGLMAPEAGAVEHVEEGKTLDAAERRRRVGLVAPDLAFYEELSARENLLFFARLRGIAAARAEELLARVGLPGERLSGALSSGMRQRLRWAWALLHRPRVLLLDEPFQNLDSPGETAARGLLAEHLAAGGLAVVASPGAIEIPAVASRLELGA
jgi:heme exporter protein A